MVKNFGTAGNKITWKFNLESACDNVAVSVWMAPCDGAAKSASAVKVTVNGTDAAWTFDTIPAIVGDAWHDYREFKTVGVALGTSNVIEFINTDGINVNIDYITLDLPAGSVIGEYNTHMHDFGAGNVCSCGAVKIEAEDAEVVGTPTGGSETFFENSERASGGSYVGNWGNGDDILTIELTVDRACDVPLGIVFAPVSAGNLWRLPTSGTRADKTEGIYWPFEVRVNTTFTDSDVVALFEKGDIPVFDGDYYQWYTAWTQPVHLNEGKNRIQIEAWDNYAANFDYIIVGTDAETTVTVNAVDTREPVIGTIEIKTETLTAGREIEFAYTVTDNKTSAENLTHEVKVYLNQGRPTEEEIAVSDNKFTPAEAGRYTIIVKVTDEAGNTATKTRSLTVVAADDETPGNPSDPPEEEEPAPSGGCGSSVGGGLAIAGTAILGVGIAIVALKKKRDR